MTAENQSTPPINKMGLDELRIKVAELCPDLFEIRETYRDRKLVKYVIRKGDEDLTEIDPTADLNACAEFEKGLDDEQWLLYLMELCKRSNITWRRNISAVAMPMVTMRRAVAATAEQRCRAFIATMEDKT